MNINIMDTQIEYIVVVNGRPFFSVSHLDNLASLVDEARRRLGASADIKVFKQTTIPFDFDVTKADED